MKCDRLENTGPASMASLGPQPEDTPLSASARASLEESARFFDAAPLRNGWAADGYHELLAHYYNLQIPADSSVLEIGCGEGRLLRRLHARRKVGVDLSPRRLEQARAAMPEATFHVQAGEELTLDETFDFVVLSETINFAVDVQRLLQRALRVSHPKTRLLLNFFNTLWLPASALATWTGMRGRQPRGNWLSEADVRNLLALSGWEVVQLGNRILFPFRIPGLSPLLNRAIAPLVPPLCLAIGCSARPAPRARAAPSVSVVVPARNEAGNIAELARRIPDLGVSTELIFVEGGSTDGTWEEMAKLPGLHPRRNLKILRQTGTGKGDAVRTGFAAATGDLLLILDADMTVEPEELPKFVEALASGRAEFANGVRLVYPMEKESMRFLNLCANKVFSLLFSWLLGQPVKDTLCGTKALWRDDYVRLAAGRATFGDFDPFGDFDLLFGAQKLGLKLLDIPIRYRSRTYGTTNIQRWKHGWLLLRMVLFAARKLKFV